MTTSQLKIQAVQTAITGDWQKAIELNQTILKEDPNDIETLNRLAFALAIIGKVKAARLSYQKVLELDSQNPIAMKNLKKLKGSDGKSSGELHIIPVRTFNMFLEESGKTKIIDLVNTADSKITSHLNTGELITLRVKRLKIFVLDSRNAYVGMLPDDIGKRLIRFLNGGNMYEACIKTIDKNKISIFVRETKKSNKFKNVPSFSFGEKSKVSFAQKHHFRPDSDEGDSEEEEE